MTLVVCGAALPITLIWWAAPRVFLFADRRLARARIAPTQRPLDEPGRVTSDEAVATRRLRVPVSGDNDLLMLSAMCDSTARALRSGRSPADALVESIDRLGTPSHTWLQVRHQAARGDALANVLDTACDAMPQGSDNRMCLELLRSSMVGPTPVAAGIEHAAAVLRDVAAMRADLAVATSQARLSTRVLTLLPFVVLLGGLATNQSFRASVTSRGVLFPLALGLVLNRVGWAWILRCLARAMEEASRYDLTELIDRVCVSLMAGCSLSEACEHLATRTSGTVGGGATNGGSSVGDEIARRVREGRTLGDALEPLSQTYALSGRLFADVLVSAERDGLPVVASVARIAQDVRMERRRRVDSAIRRIPVQLTFPLVACILPGFLLTTLVPLVASSLGALTVHLNDLPVPFGP